jgi:DnaJ-class molecular chaperone
MAAQMLLVLGVIAWVLGYAVACRVWPYRACGPCTGSGKRRSPSGRAWRKCPRCKGTGRRMRVGRWLINRWSDAARKASQ